jgi:aldose sugar dehydrogenase
MAKLGREQQQQAGAALVRYYRVHWRSMMRLSICRVAGVALICFAVPLAAQRDVPVGRGGIPPAPQGFRVPPLPEEPLVFQTAEGQDIRVVVWTRGLRSGWSMAPLSADVMLVTERAGQIRVVRNGVLDPAPVAGVPENSGIRDLALHPDFDRNRLVYFSYTKTGGAGLAVARGAWDGRALTGTTDVFVPGGGGGGPIAFGGDGMLYISTSGGEQATQDPNSIAGKILRLTDTGAVPPDNPFVGRADARPEVFTMGHRNTLRIAKHPGTGAIWQVEMGPNGGDEVNILVPGGNYGFPLASLGRTYAGPWQSQNFQREGTIDPVIFWMPSISTSSIAFYTGDRLPRWTGDVFVAGMRYGEIPGTARLDRIVINQNLEEVRRESLLVEMRRRIRDVKQGPDGLLYLLTDDQDGAILRIEPVD